jgi:predicted GIY-YIG superfamily endonuclease
MNIQNINLNIYNKKIMIQGIIYCFISPSGKKYYGYTHDLRRRLNRHQSEVRKNKVTIFYSAIKKYGWDNFNFYIIETIEAIDKKELRILLSEREKYWIKKDKTNFREFGYNMTEGGDGVLGYIFPNERKEEYSMKFKGEGNPMFGKKHSIDSIIMDKLSNTGKKMSEETKLKMSKSQSGRIHSEETKKRIGDGNRNKIISQETRIKIGLSKMGEKNPGWGKKRSDETKLKMSKSRIGKKHKIVYCPHCGKKCSPSTLSRWHSNNCKFKV